MSCPSSKSALYQNFDFLDEHSSLRVKIFKPITQLTHFSQLAHLLIGTSRNWNFSQIFFYWKFECLNCRCTLFLCLFFWYSRFTKGSSNWTFFIFEKFWLFEKHFLYLTFFRSSLGTKKMIKLSFTKILSLIRAQ